MTVSETTPVADYAPAVAVDCSPSPGAPDLLTPGSQAAAWAAQVSTPSGEHLLDPFPGNDTLPGDITPVDEPNFDGDETPTRGRRARLKLVKVHPLQHDDVTHLDEQVADMEDDVDGNDRAHARHRLTRSDSHVTFSETVESRGPPSVWASPSYSARNKYAVAGDDAKVTAPEGCGSPRRRVAPATKKLDPRAPRLLTGSTLGGLPGGYDDEEQSACCVIS